MPTTTHHHPTVTTNTHNHQQTHHPQRSLSTCNLRRIVGKGTIYNPPSSHRDTGAAARHSRPCRFPVDVESSDDEDAPSHREIVVRDINREEDGADDSDDRQRSTRRRRTEITPGKYMILINCVANLWISHKSQQPLCLLYHSILKTRCTLFKGAGHLATSTTVAPTQQGDPRIA